VLAALVGAPAVTMFFIYKIIKLVMERGKLKHQKEFLELKIGKIKYQKEFLERENKTYNNVPSRKNESSQKLAALVKQKAIRPPLIQDRKR
ncbi:MAG: hypothetical protein LBB43_02365, partial [Spirochaetaceae bacterium]|nr:hypothetical protein [Spirochaetaceae bacterium]